MKKIIVIVLIVGILGILGIGTTKVYSDENTNVESSIDCSKTNEKEIPTLVNISDYKKHLKSLSKNEANSIQKGLKAFYKNETNFSQGEKDQAFVYFKEFYYQVVNECGETISNCKVLQIIYYEYNGSVNELVEYLNNPKKHKENPKIQELTKLMYCNGMKFEMSEGIIYVSDNPNFLFNKFMPYLSEAFKEYLVILKKEDAKRFIDDACILISFEELGERIITWENFLEKYPDFIFNDDIRKKNRWYLKLYLNGTDNSSLFDYQDNTLKEEIKKAYEKFIAENGSRESGSLVKKFYDMLKSQDFKYSSKVEQFYKEYNIGLFS